MSSDARSPGNFRGSLKRSFIPDKEVLPEDFERFDSFDDDHPHNGYDRRQTNAAGKVPRLSRFPGINDTDALLAEFQSMDPNDPSCDFDEEIEFLESELKNSSSLNSVFAAMNSNLDQIQTNIETLTSNLNSTNDILSNWTTFIKNSIYNTTLLATPSWSGPSEHLDFGEEPQLLPGETFHYVSPTIPEDFPEHQETPEIFTQRTKRKSLKQFSRDLTGKNNSQRPE